MIRFLYSTLLWTALPWVYLSRLWRSRKAPAYRQRWAERFGFTHLKGSYDLWIHAVSLGEVNTALPLIQEISRLQPQWRLLITTMTPTGSARVQALFNPEKNSLGPKIDHCYLPFDLPTCLKRWLNCINPQRLAIIETELWPNLIHFSYQKKVAIYLLNARLSAASCRSYALLNALTRPMLQQLKQIAAQDQDSAERFQQLGASTEKITVTGSLKYDLSLPKDLNQFMQPWRSAFASRPIWIAASTHAGEENIVLEAHRQLLQIQPNACLLLAPRHPERFATVAKDIARMGFKFCYRSSGIPKQTMNCLFIDSLGELGYFYALAQVSFIGGSLIPQGGHNPLEAALHGSSILSGPYVHNFQKIYQDLVAQKAAHLLTAPEQLACHLLAQFGCKALSKKMGANAQQWLNKNQGASARQAQLLMDPEMGQKQRIH